MKRFLLHSDQKNRSHQVAVSDFACPRAGFTLVELLVSVALLVMIMSIFAQIFSLTAKTITTQRGIAENDKKARILFTVLSGSENSPGDLKNMTFKATPEAVAGEKGLVPFVGKAGTTNFTYNFTSGDPRKGYLYIGENDPASQIDDILQFTVELPQETQSGRLQNFYYGKSNSLHSNTSTDQMDWDDAIYGNSTSRSRKAEVCYFLRNGILYRRLLLVRESHPTDPSLATPDLFDPSYYATSNNYYSDFDFSGYYDTVSTNANLSASLDPATGSPLADPKYRFGFHHVNGQPRESLDITDKTTFANNWTGRFTHLETSDDDFQYPQRLSPALTGKSPYDPTASLTLSNGVVTPFEDGSREGEDVMMTNVLSFDVKVWDEAAGDFVDIGGSSTVNFQQGNNINNEFGPNRSVRTAGNNIFDTWHNDATSGTEKGGIAGQGYQPPYMNLISTQDYQSYTAVNWSIDRVNSIVVVPSTTFHDSLATPTPNSHRGVIGYRPVLLGSNATETIALGAPEPTWIPLSGSLSTFVESNSIIDPNNPNIRWEPVLNIKPLKAIKVIVSYRDPKSKQVKQLSVIQSLSE